MFSNLSPEVIVTTIFGSGILFTTLKGTIELGRFAQRLDNLEKRVDSLDKKLDRRIESLDTKLEGAFRYLNSRIDNLAYYVSGIKQIETAKPPAHN